LALLGLEEAGDFKFLNNAHLTKIANFLKVVPQGKFRRAGKKKPQNKLSLDLESINF
jgi:hypothetical protein